MRNVLSPQAVLRAGLQRWITPSLALAFFAAGPAPAKADGPYEGQWREGPMNIRVDVQSWGGDCGPRPRSTTVPGGGTFRITQDGDQLTFHLRQQRTTRSCWSENRAVRRVSSTHQADTWRIVCRTPAEDSRAETGTYTIRAVGDDALQFRDESRYDWQLNESRCLATTITTQSFRRVDGGAAPTEVAEPEERPTRCTPGEAARIVLRPSSAEVPLGGEQCFTARAVDANGCAVRRAALAVAEGDPGRLEGRCYRAPETEGSARVIASAGRLRAQARVTIRPMDLSDLIARRSETGSVESAAPADATTQTAARVSTRPRDDASDLLIPGLVLFGALVLVAIAVVLLRRRQSAAPKRKRSISGLRGVEVPEPEPAAGEPSDAAVDSTKLARSAAGGRMPSEKTVPSDSVPGDALPIEPGENMICPTCRRGYSPRSVRCPHDGTTLMPYREFVTGRGPAGTVAQNVCPVCGERYPPTVTFCGKDGAALKPSAE